MLRIIHVLGGLNRGGAETMIMNLYRNIDRTKIQFDFIIHTDIEQEYEKEVLELGGRIYRFPKFLGKNYLSIRNRWKNFFLNHPEYKILHSHVRSYASVYIPIAKKYGLVTIIHSHSTSNGKGILAMAKNIMQFPLRYQSDYFFGCSKEAGEWLFGKRIINSDKYYMLPNAIDVEKFKFDSDKRVEIRAELGMENKFVIGTIGRLAEPKNHKFLIDVFEEIHKKNRETQLLIVGDGDLRMALQEQVKRLRLENSVIFIGSKGNVQDYYQAMDVFAFPSLWEGFGIVAIEAQCSGLRCVISEKVPTSVDMQIGLVEIASIKNKEEWCEKLLKRDRNRSRSSQIQAVKRSGYDVYESARKLQKFYINLEENMQ